jgi:hypothetical protein
MKWRASSDDNDNGKKHHKFSTAAPMPNKPTAPNRTMAFDRRFAE